MNVDNDTLPEFEVARWNGRLLLSRYESTSTRRRLGIIVGNNGWGYAIVRFVDRNAKCYGETVVINLETEAFPLGSPETSHFDAQLPTVVREGRALYADGEQVLVFEPDHQNVTLRSIYGDVQADPYPKRVLVHAQGRALSSRAVDYVDTSNIERLGELAERIREDSVGFRGCRYDEWYPRHHGDHPQGWHRYLTDVEKRQLEQLAKMPLCCYQIKVCKLPNWTCISCGRWDERGAWLRAGLRPPKELDYLIRSVKSRAEVLETYAKFSKASSEAIAVHSQSCLPCEEYIEKAAHYKEEFTETKDGFYSSPSIFYASQCMRATW